MADLARVKNNVRKMVAQDAPEADIDAYISSEGVTLDGVRSFKGTAPAATAQPQKKDYSGGFYTTGAGLMGALEGMPIVGPALLKGSLAAAAGIVAPFSDDDFGTIYDRMGKTAEKTKEAHPYATTAGNVGGAVLGTAPLVAAAPAAFGASKAPLLARSLASGATNAAIGAADGGVRSGGKMEDAANGALWGGALGMAAPFAGQAIGAGISKVTNALRLGSPSGAQQAFARAAGADAVDDIPARLAQMGDQAMPMDLGPNLGGQAEAIAATPGKGQRIVREALTARNAQAGARATAATDKALGQPVDTFALADDIIARRDAASAPLYDRARAQPIPFTKELEELLKRPSMARALKGAQSLAADEGISSQQWFANVADDGAVTIKNVPDIRQLHYAKIALDDMISAAQRGGSKNEARILTQQKNLLLGMMDDAVPDYAKARKVYSGPSSILDAMDDGRTIFDSKLSPNELRTKLLKVSEGEQEGYLQGARARVADVMGTARNDALAVRKLFQTGYNKEKLGMIVGKERADEMLRALDSETTYANVSNNVTGNSRTAARQVAQEELGLKGSVERPGVFRSIANLKAGDAAAGAMDRIGDGFRVAARDRMGTELAELLTSRDPKAITAAVRMVQDAARRGDITKAQSQQIVQGLVNAGGREMHQRQPIIIDVRPQAKTAP